MTRKQLVFLFFLGLFVAWWQQSDWSWSTQHSGSRHLVTDPAVLTQKRSPPPTNPSAPPLKNLIHKKSPAVLSQNSKSSNRQASSPSSQGPPEPPPHAVSFKNYKGFAIAYGDVLLGKIQEENVKSGYTAIPEIQLWPSSVIPYHIQPDVPHPERVLKALAYLSERTVLEFVPFEESMRNALVFEVTEKHCLSYVGRIDGPQPLYISSECEWHHIVHEILHALGLWHEHSRPDRDQYISILWEHIPPEYHSQFEVMPEKLAKDWIHHPYDPFSIMHYGSQVFAQTGAAESGSSPSGSTAARPSLVTKDGRLISEPRELSSGDLEKINDLFRQSPSR